MRPRSGARTGCPTEARKRGCFPGFKIHHPDRVVCGICDDDGVAAAGGKNGKCCRRIEFGDIWTTIHKTRATCASDG